MRMPRNTAALLMIALGIFLIEGERNAHAQNSSPNHQFVLLTNGQVIKGEAIESSDSVCIHTQQGSKLVLANDDVDAVCESMAQAYWLKAARVKASDLQGQQQLFHWCLGHNLLDQAQNQIDILSLMPIKATKIEYLHRQLNVAFSQRDEQQANLLAKSPEKLPNSKPGGNPVGNHDVLTATSSPTIANYKIRSLPVFYGVDSASSTDPFDGTKPAPIPADLSHDAGKPTVAQVGFTEAVTSANRPLVDAVKPKIEPKVSIDELDQLTKTLPKPAVAMFKRKIEPLLVRSCFAEGCHAGGAAVMPLIHSGRGRSIPRRLSQRNLYSILKQTDPNEPLASPLLAAAMTSHGGLEEPIIKSSTKQFTNLATWLIMISNKPNSIHQMPARDTATQPIAAKLPSPASLLAKPDNNQHDEKRDNELPGDPHDPAIFNRQFGKRDADK